ncbi:MAG: Ig-like domain-containing protein, partial [Hydrogenophaga sp.]|nr:Ig-like domain-containing protein [Hydrogenophaga sp.]
MTGSLLFLLRLLPIGVLALLASACGGGGPASDPTVSTASASEVGAPRRQALSTVGAAVTPDETLDWAEFKFPSLFAKGARSYPLLYEGVAYTVRSYPNGNNLGITASGGIFGLGPFTNGELRALGSVSDFGPQIRADRCLVSPSACVSAPFSVTATAPREQATAVSATAPLKVTFSALLASAVPPSGAIRLTSDDGDIPVSVAVSANELTITPTLRLAPGRLHTLVVDTGVTDAGGRNLTRTTRVQFTTEGPAWSEPEDISFLGCQRGGVSHVLLGDGS